MQGGCLNVYYNISKTLNGPSKSTVILSHRGNANGRFLFKKWLNIEVRIGDAAGQERAKTRAREWVAANAKPEEDEDEEMEEASDEE